MVSGNISYQHIIWLLKLLLKFNWRKLYIPSKKSFQEVVIFFSFTSVCVRLPVINSLGHLDMASKLHINRIYRSFN